MANLNYNRVIIAGRLTKDPELRTTKTEIPVTSFTVAVSERAAGGVQSTLFMDCVAWRDTANLIVQYFHKGSSILIDGKLQKREWEAKDGSKRQTVEVLVASVQFVDSKSDKVDDKKPDEPHFEDVTDSDDLPF